MLDPKKFDVAHRDFYKLDKVKKAAELLDHPELGRGCILVAGTNGKGSVVYYLSRWLTEMGLKVGSTVSPHVVSLSERIQINGEPYPLEELNRVEQKYQAELSDLTYFERMTLLAFLVFREEKVDVQVVEVGIGGRLDATNISDPLVSVISSIGLDHEDVLGKGYASIAYEKSGVMRAHRSCVLPFNLCKEALDSIRESAAKQEAYLKLVEPSEFSKLGRIRGEHQALNASLAYEALRIYSEEKHISPLPKQRAEDLALEIQTPGRIQLLSQKPTWIVDGGHNAEAIGALANFLSTHYPQQKFEFVFGMMKDKDLESLEKLRPWIAALYFPLFFEERQYMPEDLVHRLGGEKVLDLGAFLLKSRNSSKNLVVCGSFYLAGEVLKLYADLWKEHP